MENLTPGEARHDEKLDDAVEIDLARYCFECPNNDCRRLRPDQRPLGIVGRRDGDCALGMGVSCGSRRSPICIRRDGSWYIAFSGIWSRIDGPSLLQQPL